MMPAGHTASLRPGERVPRFTPVAGGQPFDVAILGAGITGRTTAQELAMSGLRIAAYLA